MTQRIGKIGTITIADLSGGLNTNEGAGGVLDNQYVEGDNIYLIGKMPAKRKGYARYNNSARISTTNAGKGIFHAKFIAGHKIIAVAGSSIKVKGTNAWTDITGSVILTSGKPVMFTMINNVLVGINGTNPAWYYDGTGTAVTLTGTYVPTAPTVCVSFRGRLWLFEGRTASWGGYMGSWATFSADGTQDFGANVIGAATLGDELQNENESRLIILTEEPGIHYAVYDASLGVFTSGVAIFMFDTITQRHGAI
ncbi:MAG: hypothetical protein ABIH23_03355, partial [bacterium]